jgi:HlyD family secretion protein
MEIVRTCFERRVARSGGLAHDGERDRRAAFVATVSRVEPAAFTKVSPLGVEEQRVNVIAVLDTVPVGLGDRFRVSTSIVLWSAESALTVPSTSLVPTDEGWGVYVVEGGRARLRMVSLGQTGVRAVEVASGINVGDVVISHPDERIREGTRVGWLRE